MFSSWVHKERHVCPKSSSKRELLTGHRQSTALVARMPYTAVYITPFVGADCQAQLIARQRRGYRHRTLRLRNALGEKCPTPSLLAPTPSQLLDTLVGVIEHG